MTYFVIMNGAGDRYRCWKVFAPGWTEDLNDALKFHDRKSADDFARGDEDAWTIKQIGGIRLQKQRYHHNPDQGEYGDCYRTAIACLIGMDRDDVPHIYDGTRKGNEADKFRNEFLASKGFGMAQILFPGETTRDDVLRTMGNLNPGVYHLLSGRSETGCNHTVVCRDGQIIHDPSLTDAGIIGPCDDGFFWVEFIIPAHQVAA